MAKRLGGSLIPQPRHKIRLITVVWGESHVRALIELSWRTLLAPGNLPALARRFETSYAVYVQDSDYERLVGSPQFAQLSSLIEVEVHTFTEYEVHENRYTMHWRIWQGAIDWAKKNDALVMLAIPDVLYFEDTLTRWADRIDEGKRAVFTIGTWVAEETLVPELLQRYPLGTDALMEIPRTEGVQLILRHLHPIMAAAFRDSGHSLYHFDRMTDVVPKQGFMSKIYSSQPLLFDPGHFHLDSNKRPLNRFEDMAFEDVCIMSTGSMLHVMEFYHGQPPFGEDTLNTLTGWSYGNVAMAHAYEAKFPYHYRRDDVPPDVAAWAAAEARVDDTGAALMSVEAIHRTWRFCHEVGCNTTSIAIAVAFWRHDLCRVVQLDAAYTVLLPNDRAYRDWDADDNTRFFEGRTDPDLIALAASHVVKGRLYLRPGDRVGIARDGIGTARVAPDRCVPAELSNGLRLDVRRAGEDAPARYATVVHEQVRVGFGVIYVIDGLLTPIALAPAESLAEHVDQGF